MAGAEGFTWCLVVPLDSVFLTTLQASFPIPFLSLSLCLPGVLPTPPASGPGCERGSVPGVPSFSTGAHHACFPQVQGRLREAEVAAAEVGSEPTASSPSDRSSSQGHSGLQISGGAPNAGPAESVSTLCSFPSLLPDPTHLPRSQ